jgi:hypothetical protein
MKRLALFVLTGLFGAMAIVPAQAHAITHIELKNTSSSCAWVTFYSSYAMNPTWSIATGALRPRFLKPGEALGGPVDWSEVKLRAEVTKNSDCSGGQIADVYDVFKDNRSAIYLKKEAILTNPNGHYYIQFTK